MIICLVGLPGAGKTAAVNVLIDDYGFVPIRLGDITERIVAEEGLELNEENERRVRLKLREDFGPAAYAIKNMDRIKKQVEGGENVVVDGVRTYEEYKTIKERFEDTVLVAIHASQPVRVGRLKNRKHRPLTEEEVKERDLSELQKSGMALTLANADYTIVNEGSFDEFKARLKELLAELDEFLGVAED